MNQRKYLLLQGWGYALTVVILLVLFAFTEIDEFGKVFGVIFLCFLSYKSYSCFKQLETTREEDRVYAPNTDASAEESVGFYKKMIFIGIPAFIGLSLWTYFDLNNLESGNVESVRLWEPISLLYEFGGFWIAVLATPLLGIVSVFLLIRKIQEVKRNSDN
jgi:hypothetical protein